MSQWTDPDWLFEHEMWVDVKGCEGRYRVSSEGNVLSLGRGIDPKLGRPQYRIENRLLRPYKDACGYFRVDLIYNNGQRKNSLVHRLVAENFVQGRSGKNNVINHRDGDKTNNSHYNLEWTTRRGNTQHAAAMGLMPYGQRVGGSKLTNFQVRLIRASLNHNTLGVNDLAEVFDISTHMVRRIRKGSSWSRIK